MVSLGQLANSKPGKFKPGNVYFIKNFHFKDGEVGNKVIVIIGRSMRNEYLYVKTTSKNKRNLPETNGCHEKGEVFFVSKNSQGFNLNTWIQFNEDAIFEESEERIKKNEYRWDFKFELSQSLLNEIWLCFRKLDSFQKIYEDYKF